MLNKLIILIVLAGCSSDTAVNHMADNVREELQLISDDIKSLPKECGDQTKLAHRIDLCVERIDIMEEAYIEETDGLKEKNRRLEIANDIMAMILIVVAVWLGKRLLQSAVA